MEHEKYMFLTEIMKNAVRIATYGTGAREKKEEKKKPSRNQAKKDENIRIL